MTNEEAPTNSAGGGQVAAIGVGPDGEPPAKKKKKDATFKRMSSFKDYLVKGKV